MEKLVNFVKKLDVGEKEYTASLLGGDGKVFEMIVKAYNTEDALMKLKNSAKAGSKLLGISILDEFGNKF